MRVVAIIEARMNSSRLPGKVLFKWRDKSMMQIMVERLRQARSLDEIVVATTTNSADDALVETLDELGVSSFRGSEIDVLGRVAGAALAYSADVIVSLTGDCPIIDFRIVDECTREFLENRVDVVTNCRVRSYPIGMDTQVFSKSILNWASLNAAKPEEREHTGLYLERNRDKITMVDKIAEPNYNRPKLGLVLDEIQDFFFIRDILEHFWSNLSFSCLEVLEAIEKSELRPVNDFVARREIR